MRFSQQLRMVLGALQRLEVFLNSIFGRNQMVASYVMGVVRAKTNELKVLFVTMAQAAEEEITELERRNDELHTTLQQQELEIRYLKLARAKLRAELAEIRIEEFRGQLLVKRDEQGSTAAGDVVENHAQNLQDLDSKADQAELQVQELKEAINKLSFV